MESSAKQSPQASALIKRELFAVSLRKKKKQEILNNKRKKTYTKDPQDTLEGEWLYKKCPLISNQFFFTKQTNDTVEPLDLRATSMIVVLNKWFPQWHNLFSHMTQ